MARDARREQGGFTLIEIMITISIVGILVALALPSYQNQTRRAYFTEIVDATAPFKGAVGVCVQRTDALLGCNAGTNGIPVAITTPIGSVASITVRNGVITAIPVAQYGITAMDTYILTPALNPSSGTLTWLSTGGSVTKGYVQ